MANSLWGTVKYPSQDPRQYGERMRINIVVSSDNGQELKVWGDPGAPISFLKKGDRVQLVQGPRQSWDVVFDNSQQQTMPPASSQPGSAPPPAVPPFAPPSIPKWEVPDKDTRQQMMEFATWMAKMEKYCYGEVVDQFTKRDEKGAVIEPSPLSPGEMKDIATTITLTIIRRWKIQ